MTARELRRRLEGTTAHVGVVGQGYVGLSLAAAAATAGYPVSAVDVDAARIGSLAEGRNVVAGVRDATFDEAFATGRLAFGTDFAELATCDVVAICVPTPLKEHRPDLTAVESATRAAAAHITPGTLVILESTTYPGTTEQLVRPLLDAAGLRVGPEVHLAYSPERIDPGNEKYGMRNTPRVVGGQTPVATELAAAFYRKLVDDVHVVSSTRAAEMAKLLENTFRMVNIALVNELATLCTDQGIDVWEVIEAAATKPFGFMPFYPGPGVGGHCIPLDPTYLAWQSRRDTGRPFRLVETAQDLNAAMPAFVTSRVVDTLNSRKVAVQDADVLALGVTYKPDVGDIRESAAVDVLHRLRRKGARVAFHDPFVDAVTVDGRELRRSRLTRSRLAKADIVLLLTPHTSYDLDEVVAASRLVFDARHAVLGRHASVVSL